MAPPAPLVPHFSQSFSTATIRRSASLLQHTVAMVAVAMQPLRLLLQTQRLQRALFLLPRFKGLGFCPSPPAKPTYSWRWWSEHPFLSSISRTLCSNPLCRCNSFPSFDRSLPANGRWIRVRSAESKISHVDCEQIRAIFTTSLLYHLLGGATNVVLCNCINI